jgi:nucleotide-binding universal stress UspA family protein
MAGRIVVGVDGSDLGRAALAWARDEARLREATLVAVHAWTFVPPPPIAEPGMVPVPAVDLESNLEGERSAARSVLDDAVAELADSGLRVEPRLFEGPAGDVLVAAAADADLVVVGSHGRGGLAAALLGSVSQHVVRHASCPVVIVRVA